MPRPGEVQATAPADAGYGSDTALADQVRGAPLPARNAAPPQARPQLPMPTPGQFPPEPPPLEGDLNGGLDHLMFNTPSDRPHEPVTQGSPFGPGASFVPGTDETEMDFMTRVSQAMASTPAATQKVKAFAARVARGE